MKCSVRLKTGMTFITICQEIHRSNLGFIRKLKNKTLRLCALAGKILFKNVIKEILLYQVFLFFVSAVKSFLLRVIKCSAPVFSAQASRKESLKSFRPILGAFLMSVNVTEVTSNTISNLSRLPYAFSDPRCFLRM